MFENMTYENILDDMLSRVNNEVDKREGSIIYDTLAPCAYKLAESYFKLNNLIDLLFGDTSVGEYLDRFVADYGLKRKPATYAEREIVTTKEVGVGTRWGLNDTTYIITDKISSTEYKAQCEQLGTIGNLYSGYILPVDNNNQVEAKLIAAPLIAARDSETDEALRERFYQSYRKSPYGGNIADYEEKVLAINGVGAVKVFPAHVMGEAGKVGIVIGDTQGNTASDTLIQAVQNEMGVDGDGIAPIGHKVTVKTSTDLKVDISASVKIKMGTNFETVKQAVKKAIGDYINGISFSDTTVFFAKLQAQVLDSHEDIVDIGTVTINGENKNLSLSKTYELYQVPVVGAITVTEAE